ncbi:hypothetical protein BZARG_1340 [Bizionia argentinensis JUB59]|uniref:Uncharacterized protein n=1 Tax=Bizionia argentinensis JUB59 TaxID=1046627 RepID=G2EDJ0_9FLAO|nr:hypothetical protein [Bizionia argentinensis]EGV43528.1 hypothetical protein BZARG_1340 [Bizionia argentinensis JUB59]
MEANKFENNIKKVLEERQIQPSSEAWNQLSSRLDSQDKKSTNKYILFIGIAASVIGVLFLMNTFNPFESIQNPTTPAIVNTPSAPSEKIMTNEKNSKMSKNSEAIVATTEKVKENSIENKINNAPNKKAITNPKKGSEIRLALVDANKVNTEAQDSYMETNSFITGVSEQTLLKNNIEKAIVEASLNAEVDALLKQAKHNVSIEKSSEANNHIAHANSLLQDVELDLDKSFRDKVFETLKTNFTIVKTAVADRNN